MGRLLDNYDKLQSSPFGTTGALRREPGIASMNSQRGALTSALRRGIREAKRKGDFERVAKGISMSNAYGVQTTGIGSYEERMAGNETFADNVRKESAINADLANRAAAGVTKIGAAPQQDIPEPRDTVNPNARPLQGSGDPVKKSDNPLAARINQGDIPKPSLSLDDQALAATRRSTLDGSFGSGARDRLLQQDEKRKQASDLVDSVIDPVKGVTNPLDEEIAVAEAEKLGGTRDSFLAAIKRKTDALKQRRN